MSRIKLLPEHLIGQIKAGEVVERPAALLKEILENSLDAGARNLELLIDGQGLELIALTDDGHGMGQEDLPYAFCRHATSKIHKFDDLYALNTFGFRGEALASIASISRVTCTSVPRLPDGSTGPGGKIVLDGGHQESLGPFHAERSGTSLWVRDLFYNTPARLKFVRSRTSEKTSLKKILQNFLLAHPQVSFSVRWDQKEREQYPAVGDREARLRQLISPKDPQSVELLSFHLTYDGTSVSGLVCPQGMKAQATKVQALLCNGRWFEDRALHQALARGMAPVWSQGESGHYLVWLDVPPAQVDVNVHPQKTQLKFEKLGMIFGLLSQGVEGARAKLAASTPAPTAPRHDWEGGLSSLLGPQAAWPVRPLSKSNEQVAPSSTAGSSERFLGPRHFLAQGPQWSEVLPDAQNAPLLVDAGRLLAAYWESCTQELYPLPETHISPLLISLPYKADAKEIARLLSHRELLMGMGLSLDPLSESALALRAVPKFLALLPYEPAVRALLAHLSAWKGGPLEWGHPHLKDFFASSLHLDLSRVHAPQLAAMARKIGTHHLGRNPILALTPEALDGLFS